MNRIHKFYREAVQRFVWQEATKPESVAAKADASKTKEVMDFEKQHGEVQSSDSTVTLEDFEKTYDAAVDAIQKSPDPGDAIELARLKNLYDAGCNKIRENYGKRKEEVSKKAKEKVEKRFDEIKESTWFGFGKDTTESVEDLQEEAINEAFAEMATKTTTDFSAAVRAADDVERGKEGYAGFDVEGAGMDGVDIDADTVQQTAAGLLAAAYAEGGYGTMGPLADRIRGIAEKERDGATTEEAFYYDHFFDELPARSDIDLRGMHKDLVTDHHLGKEGWKTDGRPKGGFALESVNQARGYVMGCLLLANEDQSFPTAEEPAYKEFVYAMVDKAWENYTDGTTFLNNVHKYVLTPKKWRESRDAAAKKAAENDPALFEFESTEKAKEECKKTLSEYTRILGEKQGEDSQYIFTPEMQSEYEILSAAIKGDSFGPHHFELLKDLKAGLKKVNDELVAEKKAEENKKKEAIKKEAEKKEDLEQANEYKNKVDEYAKKVEAYKKAVDAYKKAVETDPFNPEAVDTTKLAAQKQNGEAISMLPSIALLKGKVSLVVDTEEGKKIVDDADTKFTEAGKVALGALNVFTTTAALEAKKRQGPAGTPGNVPEAQKGAPDNLQGAQGLLEEAPDDTPELKEVKNHYRDKLDKVLKSGKSKEEQEKEIGSITTQYQLEILARGFEAKDNYEELAKQAKDAYTERQTKLTGKIESLKKRLEELQKAPTPDQKAIEAAQLGIATCERDLADTNFNLKVLEQLKRDPYKEYPLSKRAVILAHMFENCNIPGVEKNLKERLGDEAYGKLFDIDGQPDFWGVNWENPDNIPAEGTPERAEFDKANKRYEAKVAEFTGQNLTMTGKERNFRMPGGMQLRETGTDEPVKLISSEIHYVKAENGRYVPFVKAEIGEGETAEQGWVALNLLKKGKGEGGGGEGGKRKEKEDADIKKQTPEVVLENRVREIVDLLSGAATLIENCNVPPKTDEDRQRLGEGIGKYVRAHATYDEMMSKAGTIMKTPDGRPCPKGPVKIKLQNPDCNREVQWNGKKLSIPGGMAGFFSGGDLDNGKGAYENCVKVLTAKGLPTDPKALEKWAQEHGCLVHDDEVLHYDRKKVTPEEYNNIKTEIEKHDAEWKNFLEKVNAEISAGTFGTEGHTKHTDVIKKAQFVVKHLEGCLTMMNEYNDIIGEVPTTDPYLKTKLYTKDIIERRIASLKDLQETMAKAMGSRELTDEDLKTLRDAGIKMKEVSTDGKEKEATVEVNMLAATRELMVSLYGDEAESWTSKQIAEKFGLDMALVKGKTNVEIAFVKEAPIDQDSPRQKWMITLAAQNGPHDSYRTTYQTVKMVGDKVYNPDKVETPKEAVEFKIDSAASAYLRTLSIEPTLDGLDKGPFLDSKGNWVGFPIDDKTKSVEVKLLDSSNGTWQLVAIDKDGSRDVINMQGNRIMTAKGVDGLTVEGSLMQ